MTRNRPIIQQLTLICVLWLQSVLCLAAESSEKVAAIGTLPESALQEALGHRAYRYGRTIKGGAHTDGSFSAGSLPALALAAYVGNETALKACMQRMRKILQGSNAPTATGGYPAQHELMFAGSAVILKSKPTLWALFSEAEQHKCDLVIKALLLASAYTTSDKTNAKGKPTCLHGGTNHARGWNPNYREGMFGNLLMAACYFGPEEAQQLLDTYKHDAFVAELKAAGLSNTLETFTYHSKNSKAPTGKQIEDGVHQFRYYGNTIHEPMAIYARLTKHTFGKTVQAGVNNGKGIKGAGKIMSGAEDLPNIGKPGMLLEFDSGDANGKRSSAVYASHGFRPNLINQAALICSGHWKANAESQALIALVDVGAIDLHYKLKHGYKDYSKGKVRGVIKLNSADHRLVHAIWEDVLKPFHEHGYESSDEQKPNPEKAAAVQVSVKAESLQTFLGYLQKRLDTDLSNKKREPRYVSETFKQEVSVTGKKDGRYQLLVPKIGSTMTIDIFAKMKASEALSLCQAIADDSDAYDNALLSYFYYAQGDQGKGAMHLRKSGEHKALVQAVIKRNE